MQHILSYTANYSARCFRIKRAQAYYDINLAAKKNGITEIGTRTFEKRLGTIFLAHERCSVAAGDFIHLLQSRSRSDRSSDR
jgi:hypothetical protein